MELAMKRFFVVAVGLWMMIVFPCTVYADSVQRFREVYESTESLTHELFEDLSMAVAGKSFDRDAMLRLADRILINTKRLEETARTSGKNMCADEAGQMHSCMAKIKKIIKTGEERHEFIMLTAKYYLHYNNCLMLNSKNLMIMLSDHMKALKLELAKDEDLSVIGYAAEHLSIHSDQMFYCAMLVGKKIWQKFAIQTKDAADAILAAVNRGDKAAIAEGMEQIERPIQMLERIVQE